MKKTKNFFSVKMAVYIAAVIQVILGIILGVKLFHMGILPTGYKIIYVLIILLFCSCSFVFAKKRIINILMLIFSCALSVCLVIGFWGVDKLEKTVETITGETETEPVREEAAEDDGAEDIEEPEPENAYKILVLSEKETVKASDWYEFTVGYWEGENVQTGELSGRMDSITDALGGTPHFAEFSEGERLAAALYNGTADAVILTEEELAAVNGLEGYADFAQRVKEITASELADYLELAENAETNLDAFVVYFSGIDVWGGVDTVSRSDVNILAVVNTKTRHIQLVNTPRDYFVELPNSNGAKDKLTHAGMYGVENSMGALEMLYGIDVDYYVRMNFSGFEAIIDTLGGVDVYSEYDFTVEPIKHYTQGINHLTGLEALAFVRERHAFTSGDNQRGKNQMALLTAMVEKVSSTDMLYNYSEVLDSISENFQTNMSSEEIYELVRKSLAGTGDWTVDTCSVTGGNGKSTTYSTPNTSTYVMIKDDEQVAAAKEKMEAVLNEE